MFNSFIREWFLNFSKHKNNMESWLKPKIAGPLP